ncbi:MAG: glycosyltransferase [Porticoccaceae bacterium]
MQILFIHQNFPGQYRNLARHFAALEGWQTYSIGEKPNVQRQLHYIPQNIQLLGYDTPPKVDTTAAGAGKEFSDQLNRARQAAGVMLRQQKNGLDPDIICAHPGWGDALYAREVFPRAKLLFFFEFFFDPAGPLVNFDAEFPTDFGQRLSFRNKNAINLLSLDMADAGICPTHWQWQTHPKEYHHKLRIIHDGVDTELVKPNPQAELIFASSSQPQRRFSKADEIVTFSVRNLEPSRGFHRYMRALPRLQKARPNAWFLIVGGDEASYVKGHASGRPWREVLLEEVGDQLDMSRILFLGKVPYQTLLDLFSISSLHIYMTIPFVLSWSMMEAMACGATVLSSATGPVQEVIEDGRNGFLFDYFSEDELVEKACALLDDPALRESIGRRARESIIERYDLASRCLPQHLALIEELLDRG